MSTKARPTKSTQRSTTKRTPTRPASGMFGVIPLTKAGSRKKTRK